MLYFTHPFYTPIAVGEQGDARCSGVRTEDPLITSPLSNLGSKSCLDVAARGVYSRMERTLFDVRIFHPGADSYKNKELQTVYKQHEEEKKRKYLDHVINVEKCSFTPLVFTTHGGQGPEAQIFHKRLATLLAKKRNILYSEAISYIRKRLRFSILHTTLIALRGYRGKPLKQIDTTEEDLNLIPSEQSYEYLN